MVVRRYIIFFTIFCCWLSCIQKPKQHIPQRIYAPDTSYFQGDFYLTNDILYADNFMGTTLGGDLSILDKISDQMIKHPEVSIHIFTPSEGPFAPTYSHCVSCERSMVLVETIAEESNIGNRISWELDSLPQYVVSDGDYHVFQTTVFVIEKTRVK